jgi:hypothetical protein
VLIWVANATTLLSFGVIVLAFVYGIFRLMDMRLSRKDMRLSIEIKEKKLAHYKNNPTKKEK